MRGVLLLFTCLLALAVRAQSDWKQSLSEWLTVEDAEGTDGAESLTMLEELAENKLNLNQLTREDIEQLPFLTAEQVEDIMAYVDRYAPVRSLSELQMITSLDRDTRHLLSHFVYVGEMPARRVWPTIEEIEKYGRHTLMATAKVPMYERKGDRNGYLGYSLRHDIRYQFTYRDRIKFGLTGAQDSGEPFFAQGNLGYDHYSYYFQLRGMGRIEELNLGMYRVQYGMGLVMNTGFHLGKLAGLQSLGRSTHALTAHSSRSSDSYLQGAAATVRLADRWKMTAFASYRPLDATLNSDGSVRTVVTDGYHRTPKELDKKNNTHVTDAGLRVSYRPSRSHASNQSFVNINLVFTHFDRPLRPQSDNSSYRRYAQQGTTFFNASLDYGYNQSRLSFSGETAVSGDGALAALHVVSYRTSSSLRFMALHRYYDRRYTAFHARSFGEGSSVQNEHGIYSGFLWTPSRDMSLQLYADYAHFPWKRYLVSAPSESFDGLCHARVLYNRCKFEGRYRFRLRQRDNDAKTMLRNRYEHRFRLRTSAELSPAFSMSAQADGVILSSSSSVSRGGMIGAHTKWKYRMLCIDASFNWFHTDDYDSRLYQYERSVLYDFSFPAYYGHGIRYSLMGRVSIGCCDVTAKLGVTDYFDRAVISSGLQQIDKSSQPDLLLQLRVKM